MMDEILEQEEKLEETATSDEEASSAVQVEEPPETAETEEAAAPKEEEAESQEAPDAGEASEPEEAVTEETTDAEETSEPESSEADDSEEDVSESEEDETTVDAEADAEEEETSEESNEDLINMDKAADGTPIVGPAPVKVTEDGAEEAPAHKPEIDSKTAEDGTPIQGDAPKKVKAKRKRWYIVHTYSGHENKVKINLERRIESMNMGDKIFRVEVPQKAVTKMKDGKRIEKDERIFPGYVLVEMIMDDDSWYVVRHTPGVTKFVGSEKKPIPARESEIRRILQQSAPVTTQKLEIDLKVGETVRITSGPFAEFEGTVTEVTPEKERLKATVSIFGRETPVELAFNQVQKIS